MRTHCEFYRLLNNTVGNLATSLAKTLAKTETELTTETPFYVLSKHCAFCRSCRAPFAAFDSRHSATVQNDLVALSSSFFLLILRLIPDMDLSYVMAADHQ